jgi:protoporphyrinogen oxidase
MARKKYDYVIIGGGLTGLLTTLALAKEGKKVSLLESNDQLGGNLQKRNSPFGDLPAFIKYHPVNEEVKENVQRFASQIFSVEDPVIKQNITTKTFDSGKFKDFVGFGKRAPEFSEVITSYTNAENWSFAESLTDLTQDLINEIQNLENVDVFTDSTLTNLILEDNRVVLAEVNSSKNFEAEEYIFTAPIHSLLNISNEDVLPVKLKTKIAKPDYWTSIHLEMLHKDAGAPTESDYILMAGTDKAIPCFGFFSEEFATEESGESKLQQSQWISFVESNLTNDMELTGNLVREMKRQVKRAHPEILETKVFERISVYPFSHGLVDVELENFKPGKLENFYLLSKEFDKANNMLGRIASAVSFLDQLDLQVPSLTKLESDEASMEAEFAVSPEESIQAEI